MLDSFPGLQVLSLAMIHSTRMVLSLTMDSLTSRVAISIYAGSFGPNVSIPLTDSFTLNVAIHYVDSFSLSGTLTRHDSFCHDGTICDSDSFDFIGTVFQSDSFDPCDAIGNYDSLILLILSGLWFIRSL